VAGDNGRSFFLTRLKENGEGDRSFRADRKLGGQYGFNALEASDGSVYFLYRPRDGRRGLVHLRANGTLDESFPQPRFPNQVLAFAYHAPTGAVFAEPAASGGPWKLGSDGKKLPFAIPSLKAPAGWIAIAGDCLYFPSRGLSRVDLNGVLDEEYTKRAAEALGDKVVCRATFDDKGRAYVSVLVTTTDERGMMGDTLFRLNADGTRDATFPSFDSRYRGNCEGAATPLPKGELLLTGRYLVDNQRYSLLHLDAGGQVKQRLFPVD
jgi:hypothetical protein